MNLRAFSILGLAASMGFGPGANPGSVRSPVNPKNIDTLTKSVANNVVFSEPRKATSLSSKPLTKRKLRRLRGRK